MQELYFLPMLMLVYSSVSGTTVFAEIQGVIDACVKLSGMPDLTLSFMVRVFNHLAFSFL